MCARARASSCDVCVCLCVCLTSCVSPRARQWARPCRRRHPQPHPLCYPSNTQHLHDDAKGVQGSGFRVGKEHGRSQAADVVCGAVHRNPPAAEPRQVRRREPFGATAPMRSKSRCLLHHRRMANQVTRGWLFLNCCRRGSSMRKTSRKHEQQRRTCRGHGRRATPATRTAVSARASSPPPTPDAWGA